MKNTNSKIELLFRLQNQRDYITQLEAENRLLKENQHDLAVTRASLKNLSKRSKCYEDLLNKLNSELLSARIEIQLQRYAEPEQRADIKVPGHIAKTMSAAITPAKP